MEKIIIRCGALILLLPLLIIRAFCDDSCQAKVSCRTQKDSVVCDGTTALSLIGKSMRFQAEKMAGLTIDSSNVSFDKSGRVIIDDPELAESVKKELERLHAEDTAKWFDNSDCSVTNENQCKCVDLRCQHAVSIKTTIGGK